MALLFIPYTLNLNSKDKITEERGFQSMKSVYKKYKDRLIEISGRNRSLYSKNISRKNSYDIGKLLHNNSASAEEFVDFLWKGRRSGYKLINFEDATSRSHIARNVMKEEAPTRAQIRKTTDSELKTLNYLKREIEEIEKETGRYELYVGYPFVEGYLKGDVMIKAPLLLFPVKLNMEKDMCELDLIPFESVQLNKALMLAYAKAQNMDLSDFEYDFESMTQAGFKNLQAFMKYLLNKGFKFKYSERKNLTAFDHARDPRPGDALEIKNHCVVGRYPTANSIYDDYNVLEKKHLITDAITALITGKEKKQKKQKDNEIYTINQLDYAQENAIDLINKTGNLVIYGPPGTGKSQTIVNIISDALCKNKRVLVVSQKKAALDVVFNRLKELNKKCIILADVEKNKIDFYERLKNTHNEITGNEKASVKEKYRRVESDLSHEVNTLQNISDTLLTRTSFGLSLQEMYSQSYNLGKNTSDYSVYEKMKKTDIIKLGYNDISTTIRVITEKNKDTLFYEHTQMYKQNPFISHVLLGLDVHKINKAKKFILGFVEKGAVPFNTAKYPNSRYLLTYLLEQDKSDIDETSYIKKLASMIYGLQKSSGNQSVSEIRQNLLDAQEAVKAYLGNFDAVKECLDAKGFAVVMDAAANGNNTNLRRVLAILNDYASIGDLKTNVNSLTKYEKMFLEFAYENSKTQSAFHDCMNKILPIRIYHEIVKNEQLFGKELSDILVFEDIKSRIVSLKKEQRGLVKDIAVEKFNEDYKTFYANSSENKNYLYEILKQRGHLPIRRLLEKYKDFLLRLFPCWLLSPETVSTVMPLQKELFDLVVFDEASQVFIENTLPTIYRGKHIAIAGDNKQLRPTNAFIKRYLGVDEAEDAESSEDASINAALKVESLLDLATSRYSSANLTYHYRSNYEELINFSNYAFYGGKLQIAPNTTRAIGNRPIVRIKVDGLWEDRKNKKEAQTVVDLVKKIFKTRKKNETIGIITFNSEQEELIKDMLDAEALKDDVFKKQYFKEQNRKEKGEDISIFVKNIENVQGDERDIIIFSIGYAKNDKERITSQFGSLSQVGGENRLNVAITRAKNKIYVITSIEPEELVSVENSKNLGPRILKKYLQYVRAISKGDSKESSLILESMSMSQNINRKLTGRGMEQQIKAQLEKQGYTVFTNLGNADYKISLGIYNKKADKYVVGIETDIAAYKSSISTLERDVYRPKFLESRGWNLIRVWSRDYWQNPNKVIKEIMKEADSQMRKLSSNK